MKKTNLFLVAALILLSNGCVSDNAASSVKGKSASSAKVKKASPKTTQAKVNFSIREAIKAKPRVAFSWSAAEKDFCSKLGERLAGEIILEQAELVPRGQEDVTILIKPEFDLTDKTRQYYRVECRQISVSISCNRKIYAMKTFTPKSLPRKIGLKNAKNQYLPSAVKAFTPFFKQALKKLYTEKIAVSVVDFSLPTPQKGLTSHGVAKEVDKIVQILNSIPGVISYKNVKQNAEKSIFTFRIIYLNEKFPQGIINAINLKINDK